MAFSLTMLRRLMKVVSLDSVPLHGISNRI